MLLPQHVLVLLRITVLTGLIKLIAKSGMLMVDVLGLLVILVLHIMETKVDVNDNLAVPTRLRVVVVYEMK